MRLILGSQSPRRRELLRQIGLDFTVLTADIDETKYETEDPVRTVRATCEAKARAVAERLRTEPAFPLRGRRPEGPDEVEPGQALILTSDTIVVLDDKIMGKPHSEAEAAAMLRALSGRSHRVYTAFTLLPLGPGGEIGPACIDHEATEVRFRPLTDAEIRGYVASGEPMDKAGAYGIQGLGALLVEGIRGDYFTVMGLPLCRLARRLREYGLDPLDPGAPDTQE